MVALTAALGLLGVGQAAATAIDNDPTGLAAPTNVIDFDELGNLQDQVITNEFAGLGASFTGLGWDDSTLGQMGPGFGGGGLVCGASAAFPDCIGGVSIVFTADVTDAAFAALDTGGTWMITSFLNGVQVETFSPVIPFPGTGFYGFSNTLIDTITLSSADGQSLAIDTLQFNLQSTGGVPEPGTTALLGLGLLSLLGYRRRQQS